MDRSAPSPGEQALSCTKGLQSERFNLPRICHPDAIVRKPLRKLHAERTIYSRPKSQVRGAPWGAGDSGIPPAP